MSNYPNRIICMTEETTETLYLLGEEDRILELQQIVSGWRDRNL